MVCSWRVTETRPLTPYIPRRLQHRIHPPPTEELTRIMGCPQVTGLFTDSPCVISACRGHDDVIKWKHFPRYWPFGRGIHRWPVNSPHKGQWRGALIFSLIYAWIKRLSKQSWGWWFEMPSRPLLRHCNIHLYTYYIQGCGIGLQFGWLTPHQRGTAAGIPDHETVYNDRNLWPSLIREHAKI